VQARRRWDYNSMGDENAVCASNSGGTRPGYPIALKIKPGIIGPFGTGARNAGLLQAAAKTSVHQ